MRAISASKAARLGAATVLAVHTAVIVGFAWTHAYFSNDDLRSFWWSATKPFADFVLDPVDDHLVPLHRVVTWVFFRLAPMDFAAGLGVLAALHVATLAALWRLLERLRPGRPENAVLVCLYGLAPCVGTQFLWWLAGLGRLGCIFFSVLTLDAYLAFRASPSRGAAVRVVVFAVCALGFYVKGILLPLYLVALELSLSSRGRKGLGTAGPFVAALVPVAAAYVWVWTLRTPPGLQEANWNVVFHARFLAASLPLFVQSSLGFFLDDRPLAVAFVTATFVAVVAATVWRSRRALIPWAWLAGLASVNLSIIALSGFRTKYQGITMVGLDRYYFDAAFLVPIFVTAALVVGDGAGRRAPSPRTLAGTWFVAAAAVALLGTLSSTSYATLRRIQSSGDFLEMMRQTQTVGRATAVSPYPLIEATRGFVRTLEASLAALPDAERRPLHLVDGELPRYVTPWGNVVRWHSELLALLGQPTRTGPDGRWRIDESGALHRTAPGADP